MHHTTTNVPLPSQNHTERDPTYRTTTNVPPKPSQDQTDLIHMEPDILGPAPLYELLVLVLVQPHEQGHWRLHRCRDEEENHLVAGLEIIASFHSSNGLDTAS